MGERTAVVAPAATGTTCATCTYMPSRPTLVVLVGLPGAGKTRYAEWLRDTQYPDAIILSSDDIRWTFGPKWKPKAEKFVWEIVEAYSRGCLIHGRDVIVDATNLKKDLRMRMVWWATEYNARSECHYVKVPKKESARRSAKWIPKKGIEALARDFEEPDDLEGFDKVLVIDGTKG